jgi:hypothetical protein
MIIPRARRGGAAREIRLGPELRFIHSTTEMLDKAMLIHDRRESPVRLCAFGEKAEGQRVISALALLAHRAGARSEVDFGFPLGSTSQACTIVAGAAISPACEICGYRLAKIRRPGCQPSSRILMAW